MKEYLLFLCVALFVFSFGKPVYAQFSQMLPTQISVDITPENPSSDQTVTMTASSYDTDLNGAFIKWSVNGTSKLSGKGKKTFSFTTGAMGSKTVIQLHIITIYGQTIDKTYTIKPSGVDIVWQTDGYAPPFYKGKTLFSYQNKIEFIAIPHVVDSSGKEIPPGNLVYTWSRNGTVLGDFSGYGRNTYTMIASVISRPLDITVEVKSPNDDGIGFGETRVSPVDPLILFYRRDPLYGIQFNQALGDTFQMKDLKEINVVGIPLFFGAKSNTDPTLTYEWSINGEKIDLSPDTTSETFRQKEGVYGTSDITLTVKNSDKFLQYASQTFNINFEKPKTTQGIL